MVDAEDMGGEAEGAQQHIEVTGSDGKALLDADAVQSHHRQGHAGPDDWCHLFMEKEAADRYQNDIKGRNEAGLSGAGRCV